MVSSLLLKEKKRNWAQNGTLVTKRSIDKLKVVGN